MTTRRELEHRFSELTTLPQGWDSWEALMRLAMEEADMAEALGEVPVGAVLVAPDGSVIAKGHNRTITANDPTAHAEILALRSAATAMQNYRVEDAVLVVTLEPCLMCTGAMVHARVRGIVYGTTDPKTGVLSSQMAALELPFHNHAIWHKGGVLADECSAQLSAFFKRRREEHRQRKSEIVTE
ncbi:tRNA adenosine(34) deaminase TadA [Desulfovibrio mangrovi]|uniref:tRNA adenosine(34) deaminase TadA n=1 Tax=Desulfovibrio mangrovi TaxID=2976983 RepID=UPI0022486CAA|nr:tRNA adenosine(34) deaminase TadA [Desulfovibrio mangrovi]UZP68528.1 tRNA adenosine(34) deaminase TadA [Desulfovibrio mangrovi]